MAPKRLRIIASLISQEGGHDWARLHNVIPRFFFFNILYIGARRCRPPWFTAECEPACQMEHPNTARENNAQNLPVNQTTQFPPNSVPRIIVRAVNSDFPRNCKSALISHQTPRNASPSPVVVSDFIARAISHPSSFVARLLHLQKYSFTCKTHV